jgi:chemotaxis protein methyltransferase CheR
MAFTYFFRDMQTLDMIRKHVVPVLRTRRFIHIWDAGCAMGPEPYSIAIILRENMGHMMFRNVRIHATDIDGSNLFGNIINNGSYPEEQVKRIPGDILNRYFTPDDSGNYIISEEIRRSLIFKKHNLLSLEPVRDDFGLIVCKNVLLHFKQEERINVIKMFHSSLTTDGFFVTEQTQKLPEPVSPLFQQVQSNVQLFKKCAMKT